MRLQRQQLERCRAQRRRRRLQRTTRSKPPRRQLLQNVIDLDTYAHIYSLSAAAALLPILVFFDFAAAFPSVSNEWLHKMLIALHFPEACEMRLKQRTLITTRCMEVMAQTLCFSRLCQV